MASQALLREVRAMLFVGVLAGLVLAAIAYCVTEWAMNGRPVIGSREDTNGR